MDLPRRTNAMRTGITTASLLHSVLSKVATVTPVPQEVDLGIDFNCELIDHEGHPTGQTFFVQCKGSESLHNPDNTEISVPIKVSTINYWLKQKSPVFLIYVDRNSEIFYWTAPYHQILNNLDKIRKKGSVSIKINKKNYFHLNLEEVPPSFLDELNDFDYTEVQFQSDNNLSKAATKVEYKEFKLSKKKKNLIVEREKPRKKIFTTRYEYVKNIKIKFDDYYETSSIDNWRNSGNQFQFRLYRKFNKKSIYHIADIIISFPEGDSEVIDYVVSLANDKKTWIVAEEDTLEKRILENRIEYIDAKIKKYHKTNRP